MKRIIPSLWAGALALCLALFGGCLEAKHTRVAGGDDIPNDVEPLGKQAAGARDDSADWNGFKAMPRSAPGLYDTTAVPDSAPDTAGAGHAQPKRGALSKGAGGLLPPDPLSFDSLPLGTPVDTLITRTADTGLGVVEAVHAQVKDGVRTVDTTVFSPPDPARPGSTGGVLQVAGRVSFADTSIWKTFRFRDADGDGSLAPRAGSPNLADIELASRASDGLVTRMRQRVAAGADLDFHRRADNRLLASLVTVTAGADTLRSVLLLDADGDSAIVDFAKDTNLVDLIETTRNSGDTGPGVRVAARLVVYSRDSTRNYAVRYRRRESLGDGGSLDLEARGPRPDSAFRAGDEAAWMVTRAFPMGADTAMRSRTFAVRLGQSPGGFAGNRLLRLEDSAQYRDRAYQAFAFSLLPDSSVADGHWPAGGEVSAGLIYRDGARTRFSGTADGVGMRGIVIDASGTSLSISFDRQGRPATAR
jgi:hypothetical protein